MRSAGTSATSRQQRRHKCERRVIANWVNKPMDETNGENELLPAARYQCHKSGRQATITRIPLRPAAIKHPCPGIAPGIADIYQTCNHCRRIIPWR